MIIAFIIAAGWISLSVLALALCQVAGRADDRIATAFMDEARSQVERPGLGGRRVRA